MASQRYGFYISAYVVQSTKDAGKHWAFESAHNNLKQAKVAADKPAENPLLKVRVINRETKPVQVLYTPGSES